jgi:hypothetical protein
MAILRQKYCYAFGCKAVISAHLLMCRTHWASVPDELQRTVYETHRAWRAGGPARPYMIAALKAKLAVAKEQGVEPALQESIQAGIDQYEKGETK